MVSKRDPRGRRKVLHLALRDLVPICGANGRHGYQVEHLLWQDVWPRCPRCKRRRLLP